MKSLVNYLKTIGRQVEHYPSLGNGEIVIPLYLLDRAEILLYNPTPPPIQEFGHEIRIRFDTFEFASALSTVNVLHREGKSWTLRLVTEDFVFVAQHFTNSGPRAVAEPMECLKFWVTIQFHHGVWWERR